MVQDLPSVTHRYSAGQYTPECSRKTDTRGTGVNMATNNDERKDNNVELAEVVENSMAVQ